MSTLYFVRHGQASLHADDYDDLSPLGIEQSTRLGLAMRERGLGFDAVYVGPKRRHRQTLEHLTAAAAGVELPAPVVDESLTEIDAHVLGNEAMRRVLPSCPDLREQLARAELNMAAKEALRHYVGIFEVLMKRWTRGEFGDELGPYDAFSSRVIGGVQRIMRAEGRKRRVLVVTSGGPISMVSRLALAATPEKSIELMFALNTASLTEIRYTENRLTLIRFNETGHLPVHMLTGI